MTAMGSYAVTVDGRCPYIVALGNKPQRLAGGSGRTPSGEYQFTDASKKENEMKIEFIESYIKKDDGDYFWNDNHGELIRCKDCKYKRLYDYDGETKYYYCALEDRPNRQWSVDDTDFCSWGEKSVNE